MATGGVANVIFHVPEPYRFHGLYAIGCIFFLLNIVRGSTEVDRSDEANDC